MTSSPRCQLVDPPIVYFQLTFLYREHVSQFLLVALGVISLTYRVVPWQRSRDRPRKRGESLVRVESTHRLQVKEEGDIQTHDMSLAVTEVQ